MRKVLLLAALAAAGCADIQPKTPEQVVFDARAAFDAGPLTAAAVYAGLPACPHAASAPCADHVVVVQIAKAMKVALAAWDAAEATVRAHPDTDVEMAMTAARQATTVLAAVLDQYVSEGGLHGSR